MKLLKTALALVCILALQQLQAQEDLRSSDLEITDSTATEYKPFSFWRPFPASGSVLGLGDPSAARCAAAIDSTPL